MEDAVITAFADLANLFAELELFAVEGGERVKFGY